MLLLIMLLVYGCSAPETIIKDKKIEIEVPAINETFPANYKNFDTITLEKLKLIYSDLPDTAVIEGVFQVKSKPDGAGKKEKVKSKSGVVKFYPKKDSFMVDIPPYKVDTTITDTLKITKVEKTSLIEKIGYGVIGAVVFLIIVFLIKRKL